MGDEERYCEHCDQTTAEWVDGPAGEACCPTCGGVLYENWDAYAEEMVAWLGEEADMTEAEVREFLTEHGNPGKGQAIAILRP